MLAAAGRTKQDDFGQVVIHAPELLAGYALACSDGSSRSARQTWSSGAECDELVEAPEGARARVGMAGQDGRGRERRARQDCGDSSEHGRDGTKLRAGGR